MDEYRFFATLQGEDGEEIEVPTFYNGVRMDKTELEEEDEEAMRKAEDEGFMRIEKAP